MVLTWGCGGTRKDDIQEIRPAGIKTTMKNTIRPRRSLLYLPADNERAMEKARTLSADMLVFDLEDSVAPQKKSEARVLLLAQLTKGGFGDREILVRVNGPDTPWGGADLAAIAGHPGHGVLLPKVEAGTDVRAAEAALGGKHAIWCMMESPLAILRAEEIAGASPLLAGFVMGLNDLGKDLGARMTPGREAFATSLSLVLLAAKAHGLATIDAVHMDLNDQAGLIEVCEQGRNLGFDGKSLIHPKQLDAANSVFGPDDADIAHAEKIIAAYGAAIAAGKGVAVVDGQLVESLHVEVAERLLALVAVIRARH